MPHANQGRAFLALFLFLNLSLATAGCSGGAAPAQAAEAKSDRPRQQAPSVPDQDLGALVDGNNAFALDLYKILAQNDGNLFYSPYSISLALAMTYSGARTVTEQEMAQAMHFLLEQEQLHPAFNALDQDLATRGDGFPEDLEERVFQLNVANAIWGQQEFEFLQPFLELLAENYGAGLRLLDFEQDPETARLTINDWVSEQTQEKIQDLIPQGALNPMARLVLTNAIYFNAGWELPFEDALTEDAPFTLLDGTQINTPMMAQSEMMDYAEGEGYQAVRLPYVGRDVEMLVLLPDEGQFDAFEAGLDAEKLANILSNTHPMTVNLALPKFSYESEFNLNEALIAMGMPSAFGYDADFSGMTGEDDLFISDVLHKAFVDVDENGTEAAAATAVIMELKALMVEDEVEMRVDRPFLFAIRDVPTGTLLFVGRVLNPGS